jgi:ankyrin repeat protein
MNDETTDRNEALIAAASRGDGAAVRMALEEGADANARDARGMTALMHAAKAGSHEAAGALLARGADAKAKGKYLGFTPIVFAVKSGSAEVVELLLNNSEGVDHDDARFALGVAELTRNSSVIELLKRALSK